MWTAIAAFSKSRRLLLGLQITALVAIAAVLSYIVLQLDANWRSHRQHELYLLDQNNAISKLQMEVLAQQEVINQLTYAIWGDLEPRVEKQEQRKMSALIPPRPNWEHDLDEIRERMKTFERWRADHLARDHR